MSSKGSNNKDDASPSVKSSAAHKSLKPLAQFAPVPAPAPAKKTTPTHAAGGAAAGGTSPANANGNGSAAGAAKPKPKAWVSLKGGKPGDDLKFGVKTVLDENDPNYDPADYADEAPADFYADEYEPAAPNVESQKQFAASIGDLDKFKAGVKASTDEFFASAEAAEFVARVKLLGAPIYHQELAHIVIKHTLDKKDEERRKVTNLLLHCFKALLVTENQFMLSFTKLYNQLDDLVVDSPNARKVVAEHAQRAADFGFLSAESFKRLTEEDAALHTDAKTVDGLKDKMKAIVREYLTGGDAGEASAALAELKAPAFHFEFVKKLISTALDQSDHQRELASVLLASLTGSVVSQDQVVKAFEILLQRVEDLYLDVRAVLHLLACFLARAVVDESVPPAFLLRQDLAVADMGYRVVKEAAKLLEGKGVAKRLENVWKQPSKPAPSASPSSASASASASVNKSTPAPELGSTGTATLVESGKKKALLSLAPLPKAK